VHIDGTEHKFTTKNRPTPAGFCANKIMYVRRTGYRNPAHT